MFDLYDAKVFLLITCAHMDTPCGNIANGNANMLINDNETNALSGSKMLSGDKLVYVLKIAREIYK